MSRQVSRWMLTACGAWLVGLGSVGDDRGIGGVN